MILSIVIENVIKNGSPKVPDIGGYIQRLSIDYREGVKFKATFELSSHELKSGFENDRHFYVEGGKKILLWDLNDLVKKKSEPKTPIIETYPSELDKLKGGLFAIFEPVIDLNNLGSISESEGYEEIYRDENIVEATISKFLARRLFVKGSYFPHEQDAGYIKDNQNNLFPLVIYITSDIKKLHNYLFEKNYDTTEIIELEDCYKLEYWDKEGHLIGVFEMKQ